MDANIKNLRDALEWLDRSIREEAELDGEMTATHASQLGFIQSMLEKFPLRNCDVGTPEEQHERFAAFCKEVDECAYCAIPGLTSGECALLWAGLPFGTKNNERGRQTCANCGTNHDSCETENCKRYGVCGNWTAAQEGGE